MPQGGVQASVSTGNGSQPASSAGLARAIVQMGIATLLKDNTLGKVADPSAIASIVGSGPLAEVTAFCARGGQTRYAFALPPSAAGAISAAVAHAGTGTGVITPSVAPGQLVELQITTPGALGSMAFKWRVGGVGNFSAPIISGASGPYVFRVPGTLCHVSFAAGTYVVNSTYAIGIDGSLTLGGSAINTVTFTADPIDYAEVLVTVEKGGVLGSAIFSGSLDNGNGDIPDMLVPASGVVTIPGTGLVLTVGQHVIVITMTTAGALGTAIYSYTIDGGSAVTGQTTTPNNGGNYVVTIPGTGVTFTFAPGTYVLNSTYTDSATGTITVGGGGISTVTQSWAGFVIGDTYAFLAAPPSCSISDVTVGITALRARRDINISLLHIIVQPTSAANAIALCAAVQSQLDDAFNNDGLDWQALVECPSAGGAGDIIISGGNAIYDTADTDAVVTAARLGSDFKRVALHCATHRCTSAITSVNTLRPFGWFIADRLVDTGPSQDPSEVDLGPLRIFKSPIDVYPFGRDEATTPGLDDVQINVAKTYRQEDGAFLTITSGGSGWKNLTADSSFQSASAVRAFNLFIQALRFVGQKILGQEPQTNKDGTVAEKPARKYDTLFNNAGRRAVGLEIGGSFVKPQASDASASILRSSQLGVAPKRADISYDFQSLGFISDVSLAGHFSGTLTVTQ